MHFFFLLSSYFLHLIIKKFLIFFQSFFFIFSICGKERERESKRQDDALRWRARINEQEARGARRWRPRFVRVRGKRKGERK